MRLRASPLCIYLLAGFISSISEVFDVVSRDVALGGVEGMLWTSADGRPRIFFAKGEKVAFQGVAKKSEGEGLCPKTLSWSSQADLQNLAMVITGRSSELGHDFTVPSGCPRSHGVHGMKAPLPLILLRTVVRRGSGRTRPTVTPPNHVQAVLA